jgi:hypothetical protein
LTEMASMQSSGVVSSEFVVLWEDQD